MLSPYRVLDLTNEEGLLCGQILADLGADVIAIEPPGGSSARRLGPFAGETRDPNASLYWWAYSRNKRSLTLDIETEQGRQLLRDLVRSADFLLESFPPGFMDGLGLGYAALRQLNPRLVMVSITAFGAEGPKAHYVATDLTALAASGLLLLTGDDDRPPVRTAVPQAFLHAGAEAAVGALIAHHARERDGIGQHVDVSAQTAAMLGTQAAILADGWGDRPLQRIAGGMKAGRHILKNVYACEDGHISLTMGFGSVIGPFTARLVRVMHEDGFVDEATRDKDWIGFWEGVAARTESPESLPRLTAAIERFMLSHTKAELFTLAQERRLLIAPINTVPDLLQSPQYAERGYWTALQHEDLGREVLYPGPFAKLSGTPIQYRSRPPFIGEHTDEILAVEQASAMVGGPSSMAATQAEGKGTSSVAVSAPPRARRTRARPFPAAGAWDSDFGPPLAGVKVLDFMWVIAGPTGTRYLSDYGATVVHVESSLRPDTLRTVGPFKDKKPGLERSANFATTNAGKLGLSLNLTSPEARDLVLKLAAWADVVTESFTPRAMRGWGLGYEDLRKVNPGIIMISSCLNGQTGPLANLAGFGNLGAALSGFYELTGWPDRIPAGPFSAYTDTTTPKFVAASLLAALDHRRRTGEGQYIDLSQAECSMHFLAPAILDFTVNGNAATRAGNRSPDHAPHGVYPCKGQDRWLAISCATPEQWLALCDVTGHPHWREDARFATFEDRQRHAVALDATLSAWTTEHDTRDVVLRLQAAGVPAHRVVSSVDAFADAQLKFRGHFVTVDDQAMGRVSVESSRLRFSHARADLKRAGPAIGQDNEYVLKEILGMDDEAIVELVVSGALT